ncbi:Zn-dependent exopeptidase [Rhizoclosmatium globosum]|uniref:Peptide hydrolase n=1 Tax=Rhizoclosmatium globosum TaxID=329046 RepID=A0A1Y2BGB3_9FUNG|nr:Zn-dependent exopeptidase [Rhizoclosmatium globosum]|eukprot:ORY33600.1 Zn-dependent exopeptidase [Rhizoclosmatium globosum]
MPSTCSQQSAVTPLLTKVSIPEVTKFLTGLTLFPERFYTSKNGVDAANWIAARCKELPVPAGTKLTISLFNHTGFIQPSVIARYESATPPADGFKGTIIIGSHFDTATNGTKGNEDAIDGPNPGADDCSSGSTSVFEALRVLTTQGFIPGRALEFHWYAAEEVGLYGSIEIARQYAKQGRDVVGYLNLDQTGYVRARTTPIVGIFSSESTAPATKFISSVVATYSGLPQVGGQKCDEELCSDNFSWTRYGFESAMLMESGIKNTFPYNDMVKPDGSPLDTLDVVNMTHVAVFAKIALGWTVELSLATAKSSSAGSFVGYETAFFLLVGSLLVYL